MSTKGGGGVFNTYLGIWLNVDLGDPSDDYVGFDSVNGIAFAWNGDDFDGGAFGYGDRPSALGVVALEGVNVADDGVDNDRDGEVDENDETVGLTRFVSYRDDDSPFGNPTNGQEAYQYLSGNWRNGSPIIFGGDGTGTDQKDGLTTTHIYTGIPPNFWSEENIDGAGTRNEPGERRFIASLGPFSLHAGQTRSVTFAIVWAQGNDRFDSIASLRTSVTGLRQIFDEGFPTTSTTSDELTSPTRFDVVENFPNPFAVTTNIRFTIKGRAAVRLVIVDPLGRTVREESLGMLDAGLHSHTVLREELPSGIYFYQLATESESRTGSMAVVK